MYTFGKQERLCSKKTIDALFLSGHRLMLFPYSVHWMLCPTGTLPDGVPAQVKRLTRECYRIHKPKLYEYLNGQGLNIALSINYIHNEIFDYHTLNNKFERLTDNLIESIAKQTAHNGQSDT